MQRAYRGLSRRAASCHAGSRSHALRAVTIIGTRRPGVTAPAELARRSGMSPAHRDGVEGAAFASAGSAAAARPRGASGRAPRGGSGSRWRIPGSGSRRGISSGCSSRSSGSTPAPVGAERARASACRSAAISSPRSAASWRWAAASAREAVFTSRWISARRRRPSRPARRPPRRRRAGMRSPRRRALPSARSRPYRPARAWRGIAATTIGMQIRRASGSRPSLLCSGPAMARIPAIWVSRPKTNGRFCANIEAGGVNRGGGRGSGHGRRAGCELRERTASRAARRPGHVPFAVAAGARMT